MSTFNEAQMRAGMERAASEAAVVERARCLWVLDRLIAELEADLQRKLLIEQQRHMIETKLKIARGIVAAAKRGIVSGARPPQQKDAKES